MWHCDDQKMNIDIKLQSLEFAPAIVMELFHAIGHPPKLNILIVFFLD